MTRWRPASALLSWLLGEPDGDVARRILDAATVVLTSRLTLVEAARGLLRAEHERRISAADRHTLTGMLAAAAAGWFRLSMADATCERAETLTSRAPVPGCLSGTTRTMKCSSASPTLPKPTPSSQGMTTSSL